MRPNEEERGSKWVRGVSFRICSKYGKMCWCVYSERRKRLRRDGLQNGEVVGAVRTRWADLRMRTLMTRWQVGGQYLFKVQQIGHVVVREFVLMH